MERPLVAGWRCVVCGASIDIETWALHRTPRKDEYQQARTNAIRFLHYVEVRAVESAVDIVMFTRTWGLPPEATDLWRRLEVRP